MKIIWSINNTVLFWPQERMEAKGIFSSNWREAPPAQVYLLSLSPMQRTCCLDDISKMTPHFQNQLLYVSVLYWCIIIYFMIWWRRYMIFLFFVQEQVICLQKTSAPQMQSVQ